MAIWNIILMHAGAPRLRPPKILTSTPISLALSPTHLIALLKNTVPFMDTKHIYPVLGPAVFYHNIIGGPAYDRQGLAHEWTVPSPLLVQYTTLRRSNANSIIQAYEEQQSADQIYS